MSKHRPGLPDDFQLSVAPEAPVQLEDYLDRELPPESQPAPKPRERKTEPAPSQKGAQPKAQSAKRDEKAVRISRERSRPSPAASARSRSRISERPPRMELSLDAETQRKAEEVVADIQGQGPQPDATASEFVRALVQLAHDVRHKADYSHLNRRGQWGSATAKAFVADLKEAFLRAVGEHYVDRYPSEAEQQLGDAREPQ